jgi:hypothetical protein
MSTIVDPNNRFLGSKAIHKMWAIDWACVRCQAFGALPFSMTGGGMSGGKWNVSMDDATFTKRVWHAHKNYAGDPFNPAGTPGGNLCLESLDDIRIGRIWRKERTGDGERLVLMLMKGETEAPKVYTWPPWRQ